MDFFFLKADFFKKLYHLFYITIFLIRYFFYNSINIVSVFIVRGFLLWK